MNTNSTHPGFQTHIFSRNLLIHSLGFFFLLFPGIINAGNALSCPGSLQLSQNVACVGDCITVTYNGPLFPGAAYTWSNSCGTISGGNNSNPHTVCFTSQGLCTIQLLIQQAGAPPQVCDVTIQVYPKPNASFGAEQKICFGGCVSIQVNAIGPAPYIITVFNGTDTITSTYNSPIFYYDVCPTVTTTYTITSITAGPCTTVYLNNSTTVNVYPGVNASMVQNGNSLIVYPYSSIFNWITCNEVSLNYYLQIYSPPASGCYCCIVTDPITLCQDTVCADFVNECDLTCAIIFDDTICAGDMVTFTYGGNASPNATYNWIIDLPGFPSAHYSGMGPITIQYNDTSCYNVSLTVDENNCSAYCSGLLCVKEQSWTPNIFQNNGTLIAFPNDSSFTYTWHACNDTTILSTQQTYKPDTAGCYCVIFTDKCGCKDTACIDFPIPCNLTCNFIGADSICVGDSVTLTYTGNGSPNAIYNWVIDVPGYPGLHFIGIGPKVITYNVPGCYHVSLTVMENNCQVNCQDSFCVKLKTWEAHFINQNGTLYALPNDPGSMFVWTHCNDTAVISTQVSYTPAVPGCYCCIIIDKCGCRDTVCSDINIPCNLSCSFSGADSICVGDSVILTYTGNGSSSATYNWVIDLPGFPGLHFIGIGPKIIAYDTPGCYHVSLTVTENNCTSTCQDSFCVVPVPTADLCCDITKCGLCHDLSISFTGSPPWYVQISDGSNTSTLGPISSTPYIYTVCPTDTTTYNLVQVTDSTNICTGIVTGSATVNVLLNPIASISISGDTLCASPANLFYGWWTCNGSPYFSTDQCVVVNQPGCYCVTVSTNFDCVDSACVVITSTHNILQSDKIWVYPVPAFDELSLKILVNNLTPDYFEIVDLNGRLIKKIMVSNKSADNIYSINIADIGNGMNFIKTYTKSNIYLSKFIKQ